MILGLGESEKQFKNAMEAADADMSVVNSWLKLYQRTKKNSVNVTNKYYVVKANLNKLLSNLKEIEQLIISDEQDPAVKKKIGHLIDSMFCDDSHTTAMDNTKNQTEAFDINEFI